MLNKNRFKLKKLSPNISFKSFEFTDCTLNYASTSLRMVVVYRPPPSQKNRLSVTLFLDEFSSLLEKPMQIPEKNRGSPCSFERKGAFISLSSLRTVPTNSEVFLRGLLNVRGKQISTSDIEIQKEN